MKKAVLSVLSILVALLGALVIAVGTCAICSPIIGASIIAAGALIVYIGHRIWDKNFMVKKPRGDDMKNTLITVMAVLAIFAVAMPVLAQDSPKREVIQGMFLLEEGEYAVYSEETLGNMVSILLVDEIGIVLTNPHFYYFTRKDGSDVFALYIPDEGWIDFTELEMPLIRSSDVMRCSH